jgi:outer membrane protein assembly factor BamD (BamD/ComL family)
LFTAGAGRPETGRENFMKRNIIIGLGVMMCLAIIGCATVDGEWKKASQLNTIESYQKFVSEHPGSKYEDQARKMIAKLDWQDALSHNSVASFNAYLSKHPKSEYAEIAEIKIEALDWRSAVASDDITGYRLYIKKHPDSQNALKAKSMVEDHDWQAAQKVGNMESYKKFLADYPKSKHTHSARSKLELLKQEQERMRLQKLCADKEVLKTFPAWLKKGKRSDKQSGPRHTALDSLYFGPYYFEVHSPISIEVGKDALIYFDGKGIITGADNRRVLVGYECR